jgi:hypothetical protein
VKKIAQSVAQAIFRKKLPWKKRHKIWATSEMFRKTAQNKQSQKLAQCGHPDAHSSTSKVWQINLTFGFVHSVWHEMAEWHVRFNAFSSNERKKREREKRER